MAKRLEVKELRIREFCEARGWSVDDLSRFSWIKYPTARNLYYGITLDASLTALIPIARTLGVTVDELVVLEGEEPDPVDITSRPAVRQEGPLIFKRTRVKELCEAIGWDGDDLARASGVKFNTVRSFFYRPTSAPTVSTAIPVARALGMKAEELIEEGTVPKQTPLGNIHSYAT